MGFVLKVHCPYHSSVHAEVTHCGAAEQTRQCRSSLRHAIRTLIRLSKTLTKHTCR